jgi:hypothetical protein
MQSLTFGTMPEFEEFVESVKELFPFVCTMRYSSEDANTVGEIYESLTSEDDIIYHPTGDRHVIEFFTAKSLYEFISAGAEISDGSFVSSMMAVCGYDWV